MLGGTSSQVTAPQPLRQALAAPGWTHGCALLPQSALAAAAAPGTAPAADAVTMALDPASGTVQGVRWADAVRGEVAVAYADYRSENGVTYPGTVTETVAGAPRLTVHFTSVTPQSSFDPAEFAVKPPPVPAPATPGAGGGQ